ncbi:MAG: GNAT family N-acetyltransferase [Verrucomicrobiota bacterium]|nr:GNAT family N-acetyltransferase [Verrucomicrobiota bacterium]
MRAVLVEEAEFGSKAYGEMLSLRKRILRDPLGLKWTEEEESWEPREQHFGVRVDSGVVACVVIRPLGNRTAKLRQMAVEPAWQGTGIGRGLLEGVEKILVTEELDRIELNARETAVGFYEKQGFRKMGEEFLEVTIPHWKMVKALR